MTKFRFVVLLLLILTSIGITSACGKGNNNAGDQKNENGGGAAGNLEGNIKVDGSSTVY